jgi:hypothetical protein
MMVQNKEALVMKKRRRTQLQLFSLGAVLALVLVTVQSAAARLQERVVIPEGEKARLVLQTPLSTRISEAGDPVHARLMDDVYVEGQVVLRQGTTFSGRVTAVREARRGQRQATLAILFDRIITPYGEEPVTVEIVAIDDFAQDRKLKPDGEGTVKGGRDGSRTVDNAIRGGWLGYFGAASVILIGRSDAAATAGGIALGGAMASGTLITRGKNIQLSPGTVFRIRFGPGVTVRPAVER